jgi:hypothetical protein
MSNASLAAQAPSISDHIEAPNDKRRCATSKLAERLRRVAEEVRDMDQAGALLLDGMAWRLFQCARAGKLGTGWRCWASYCPRCSRQTAIKYRKRLERRMFSRVASGGAPHGFALLTLTVAAPGPLRGHQVLRDARTRLFRGQLVRSAIAGGDGHVHAEPARGADANGWNVHLHAVVELACPLRSVNTSRLQTAWADALAHFGASGSLDLRREHNLTSEFFRDGRASQLP